MRIDPYKFDTEDPYAIATRACFTGTARETMELLKTRSLVGEDDNKKFKLTWEKENSELPVIEDEGEEDLDTTVEDGVNELEQILKPYRITNEGVKKYILEHPKINSILGKAHIECWKFFPEATLWLNVWSNPEDGAHELMLEIATNLPAKERGLKLEELDRHWWIERAAEWHGVFSISLY